ncbi:RloB family protein [Psychrobacter urativorans]|uniref:RloB family protein n=1 Tax=Psychrobacter urativorans TaxID=45610 RepID=UPI00191B81A6|nr:RloB family protein [Psychrobacter urativorans]
MGTDNLHHKRKARKNKDLRRKQAQKSDYEKILIVCEGEKTEPYYFNNLINYHKLNTANINVVGDCDSAPIRVLERAKELYEESKDTIPYDKVYCVFDKDSHSTYLQTLNIIKQILPLEIFIAITSIPCFEYWILLHFTDTTKSYNNYREVSQDLKIFLPLYEKKNKNIYSELLPYLEVAKRNANKANMAAIKNQTDNPSTKIHELVEVLETLNKKQKSQAKY